MKYWWRESSLGKAFGELPKLDSKSSTISSDTVYRKAYSVKFRWMDIFLQLCMSICRDAFKYIQSRHLCSGGGISVGFTKFVSTSCEQLYRQYGISPLMEYYSNMGLQSYHAYNKNYAIVSSDECHRILAGIGSKEGHSKAERAFINKTVEWEGKPDISKRRAEGIYHVLVLLGYVYPAAACYQRTHNARHRLLWILR